MQPLIGRGSEVELVESFIAGSGTALLLEGPAGIGKTTLWEWGVDTAQSMGLTVLVARPAEEEMHFAYSGLADLFAGIDVARVARLSAPQMQALEAALSLGSDPQASSPAAVVGGVLSVLRALATRGAVVAVDDVLWLDTQTASALAFAARRVNNVRFLLAGRPGGSSPLTRAVERGALHRLRVEPLGLGPTRRLLYERLGLMLPRRAMTRLFEASQGNPLFALELARVLAGDKAEVGHLDIPVSVEELLAVRVGELGLPVRKLVLAVALGPGSRIPELPGREALYEAMDAGAVTVCDGLVRLSHPLLGAASIALATHSERRATRLELAAAAGDDDRRSYHLALATDAPDARVADLVASAAGRAASLGAVAQAAVLGEHALRLTPEGSAQYTERLLDAVEYLQQAGELSRGRSLLGPRLDVLPAGRPRVRGYLLACGLDLPHPDVTDDASPNAWTDDALEESSGDPELHAQVVAQRCFDFAIGYVRELAPMDGILRDADESAPDASAAVRLKLLGAAGWVRAMRGRDIDDLIERAKLLASAAMPVQHTVERIAAVQLAWRGRIHEARQRLEDLRLTADARGEEEGYFIARLQLCELELRAGHLDRAAAWLEEWSEQAEEPIGASTAYARCQAMLTATRGSDGEATRWLAIAMEAAEMRGNRWHWLEAHRANGIAALASGHPERAAEHLRATWEHTRAQGVDEPGAFPVAPDLVEALVAVGEIDEAEAVTEQLGMLCRGRDHPWLAATEPRCRSLLRLGAPESIPALQKSAEAYGHLGLRFDRARTLLSLGRALRMQGRRRGARIAFDEAALACDEAGCSGWAERAREELAGVSGRRSVGNELTPTEDRVARLVASGHRNREVAAKLLISVSAVEAHLSRVYAKLGLRSRTELARHYLNADRHD